MLIGPCAEHDDYFQLAYRKYQQATKEESDLLGDSGILSLSSLTSTFGAFVNLEKVHIVNGTFSSRDRRVTKQEHWCQSGSDSNGPIPMFRGEHLHYPARENGWPALHTWKCLLASEDLGIRELRVDALSWRAFKPDYREKQVIPMLCGQTLTCLTLIITVRNT